MSLKRKLKELKMNVISNEQFFDCAAEYYDSMVDFEKGLERRIKALSNFIDPDMKTAADLGCGTGLDSISLSTSGISVTGFDISQKMITQSRKNAKRFGAKAVFHKYSFENIPLLFNNKFDLITSLGNSLANLDERQLEMSIDRIYKMLRTGGKLVIQILNYNLILKEGKRIIKIAEDKNFTMIRFYDFLVTHLNFNILKYNHSDTNDAELITTKIFPHRFILLEQLLNDAGFLNIRAYGDFNKNPFRKTISKDLIITARK